MTMPSMPQLVSDDQDDSTADEVILGVDTHHDGHVAAVITALGVLVDTAKFPTTAAGYQALVGWVATFGVLRRAGVEGTGSYGAALARHLRAAGVEVIEVNAPDKATRRRQGKTDTLDAEAAARAVLSGRASGSAKAGDGPVEMLPMLKLAKDSAIKARTQAINQPESRARGGRSSPARGAVGPDQHHAHPSLRAARDHHAPRCHQRGALHPALAGAAHP
jgi:transposase